jgi:hypothetical protein
MWLCTANVRVILSHYYHIRQRFSSFFLFRLNSSICFCCSIAACPCEAHWFDAVVIRLPIESKKRWYFSRSRETDSRSSDTWCWTLEVNPIWPHSSEKRQTDRQTNRLDLKTIWRDGRSDQTCECFVSFHCFFLSSFLKILSCFQVQMHCDDHLFSCIQVYSEKLHSLYISPSKITHSLNICAPDVVH